MTRGPRIVDDRTRAEMKKILQEIRSGQFAREWILENSAGRPVFKALERLGAEHPIETVGARLRSMMSWISAPWKRNDRLIPLMFLAGAPIRSIAD